MASRPHHQRSIELPAEDDGKIKVTVENLTDNDIVLSVCTTLGLLHSVEAIYLLPVKVTEEQTSKVPDSSASLPAQQPKKETSGEPLNPPPVDLSHLSEEQRHR